MDTFRRRLALALLVLGVCATSGVRAEVRLQESTEHFDIGFVEGNPDQLWKGLQRNGPFAHTGIIVGTTKSNASLTRTVQQTAKGCVVKTADVNMTLLVTLPAWSRIGSLFVSNQSVEPSAIDIVSTIPNCGCPDWITSRSFWTKYSA